MELESDRIARSDAQTLQLFAGVSIVFVGVPMFAALSARLHPVVGLLGVLPLIAPYGALLYSLGKRGVHALGYAAGVGGAMLVLAGGGLIALAAAASRDGLGLALALAGVAIPQLALIGSAFKVHLRLRDRDGSRKAIYVATGLAFFLSLFSFMVALALPPTIAYEPRIPRNEAATIGWFRETLQCVAAYSGELHEGIPERLSLMGPKGTACLEEYSSSENDTVRHGYRFEYVPGPRDASGVIRSYTLRARPVNYSVSGYRSFFASSSSPIRSTSEDRPATETDPELR